MWIGVQTSIFSEGFFRGNINSDAITYSLKCSFLATFEPTKNPGQFMTFRIGYSAVGLGCIAGVILLILNAIRK
jgi:hypothetical protein